ncbi:pirin family protein [Actinomycetospora endophytica]|uniref:Pirin family protein n=1 Tax=Actinomycetospora endophytica TaxID=2291215 RepID=A0ABS8P845_9PSEU|nr:pirin family protein [Actinomycetospora endophytica]MCD2194410.1 pirin family protein [Actinomycetospora endophytica]
MSNVEVAPDEIVCGADTTPREPVAVEILTPREVPLGGPRAMTVRRTLPQRRRSLIGAWCFVDHYGPDDVGATGGMDVAPHPHTGLATVSWLFTGEVEHRDSHGVHAIVRPGELNLMTGGHGVCHSEVSTPDTSTLHGAQLWLALPDAARDTPRAFAHHAPEPVDLGSAEICVFLGTLAGVTSPVETFSPLLGAEIVLAPHGTATLDVDPAFEHGLLLDAGTVAVAGPGITRTDIAAAELGYLAPGPTRLELANDADTPARLLLLGGTPFGEQIVMWWNFVARTHDEIVAFRTAWEDDPEGRYGHVSGYVGKDGGTARLHAPALPNARIKPRG